MRLVSFELAVVRVLDKNVAPSQLSRCSTAEVIHHRYGCPFFGHFQKSLKVNNLIHQEINHRHVLTVSYAREQFDRVHLFPFPR